VEEIKFNKELECIKQILSRLIPLGRYKAGDENYRSELVEKICNVERSINDTNHCESELKYWINFYENYFGNRFFLYAQAFLNTTIVTELLEEIGYLYGIVLLDIDIKDGHLKKRFVPLQLYDSHRFMYFKLMNRWHEKQKEYIKLNHETIINHIKEKKNYPLWNNINEKYKKLSELVKNKENRFGVDVKNKDDIDWIDLFEAISKVPKERIDTFENNIKQDFENIYSFLLLDIFDYYEFNRIYEYRRKDMISKIVKLRDVHLDNKSMDLAPDTLAKDDIRLVDIYENIYPCVVPIPTELIEIKNDQALDLPQDRFVSFCLVFLENKPQDTLKTKEAFILLRDFIAYTISPSVINIRLKIEEEYKKEILRHATRAAVAGAMVKSGVWHNSGTSGSYPVVIVR
jgi:hypothetical protein